MKYMNFFKEDFQNLIQWHIPHQFSKEMSKKSEVVSKKGLDAVWIIESS